ncbi:MULTISPECIES: hypothetical protein [unclassified Agrobacterium]
MFGDTLELFDNEIRRFIRRYGEPETFPGAQFSELFFRQTSEFHGPGIGDFISWFKKFDVEKWIKYELGRKAGPLTFDHTVNVQPSMADFLVAWKAVTLVVHPMSSRWEGNTGSIVRRLMRIDSVIVWQFSKIRQLRSYAEKWGWHSVPLHLRQRSLDQDKPAPVLDFTDSAMLTSLASNEDVDVGALLERPNELFEFLSSVPQLTMRQPLREGVAGSFAIALKSLKSTFSAYKNNPSLTTTASSSVTCKFQAVTDPIDVLYSLAAVSQRMGMGVSRKGKPAQRSIPPADYCFGCIRPGQTDLWDTATKTVDHVNFNHNTSLF